MNKIIILNKKICKLDVENHEVIKLIDDCMSYQIPGAKYSLAFKAGKWDGRKYFINNDLTFPRPLLNRVVSIFKQFNLNYDIITNIDLKDSLLELDITNALQNIDKVPYQYQKDAASIVKQTDCGILRLPTGSGKTLIISLMTALLNKRTIIYVIGVDLLYQIYNLFSSIFGSDVVGIVGDGLCDIKDITIMSIWTAGLSIGLDKNKILEEKDDENILDKDKYSIIIDCIKEAKVIIFDECHMAKCETFQEISKISNYEYIYGMSASPFTGNADDLLVESILGPKIIDISAEFLINNGFLVEPRIKFNKVPPMRFPKGTSYKQIYSDYIVNNETRNNLVHECTKIVVDLGHKTLVLFNTIKHGEILYNLINKDIPCTLLSGKDSLDIRNKAKEDIENDKIQCIIASSIWDIGVDVPSLSGLVLSSGQKSSIRALQRIGRVIRKTKNTPNKTYAAVFDFQDNAKYLSEHSKARRDIYLAEKGFRVKWPGK